MSRTLIAISLALALTACGEGYHDDDTGQYTSTIYVHQRLGGYLCDTGCWLDVYKESAVFGSEYVGRVRPNGAYGLTGTLYSYDRAPLRSQMFFEGVLSYDISGNTQFPL